MEKSILVSTVDEELHREIIHEHADHPYNKTELADADLSGRYVSPKTGNHSRVFLKISEAGKVSKATFLGQGSALSIASGSLFASHASGMTLSELAGLGKKVERVILGDFSEELPGDLNVYLTIARFPERHDCALLAWRALDSAIGADAT